MQLEKDKSVVARVTALKLKTTRLIRVEDVKSRRLQP